MKLQILNKEFVKRDFWYILVCMLAILGCMYTLHQNNEVLNTCNTVWAEYVEDHCACGMSYGDIMNFSLPVNWEGFENEQTT